MKMSGKVPDRVYEIVRNGDPDVKGGDAVVVRIDVLIYINNGYNDIYHKMFG